MFNILKKIGLFLLIILVCTSFACKEKEPAIINDGPDEPITLTIAGAWSDCLAIDEVARDFTKNNPNISIVYENIQNYYSSLSKRLAGDNPVDMFFTINLQSNVDDEIKELLPYALDLMAEEEFDTSNTFSGLIDNFMYREDGKIATKLFSIPVGAEMRGMYVNKTLLNKYSIEVPTNQDTLLTACAKLKENNLIAFHGNPGDFASHLLYPWICNIIANAADYTATFNKVNNQEAGTAELFREPFEFMNTLITNRYYDYKYAQSNLNLFNDSTDEDYAKYFLNLQEDNNELTKIDDIGQIAFMPGTLSLMNTINEYKEGCHSKIDYEFIPSPIGNEGGFVYLSPSQGIAINKESVNVKWAVKFLNYLFTREANEKFAQYFNCVPNTKDAFTYIKSMYNVSSDRVSELGQVTFDYDFYNIIKSSITNACKANNPKYMINLNKNEEGEIQYLLDENDNKYLMCFDNVTKVYQQYVGNEDLLYPNHAFCSVNYFIYILKENIEK